MLTLGLFVKCSIY